MSEYMSIIYFDDPRGMQLIEEVLRKIGIPYDVPPQSAESTFMIQVKSNRSSRKVIEACKEYFSIEGPALSTSFTASGFTTTPAWEFKLLSLELKLESIPQVAERIVSNPATE